MNEKVLSPDDVDYVIYHSPCCDGTGSGLAAWLYLSKKFPDRVVTYKPMPIGAPPPDDLEGKNVLICDYSYRKDVLLDLLTKVNKLLIIDHHKSAEKDLAEIDDCYKIFNMKHSGAVLTWIYFFPEEPIPMLIEYIQDRDIWTKALPNTDDFFAAISILPHDFTVYAQYLDFVAITDLINNKGKAFGELNKYNADYAAVKATPKFCKIKGKYYIVGYVNTTVLKSDVGNMIFDKLPHIDFSVAYSISDKSDSTSFSLRSTPKHADVSEIAFSFAGGGHAAAAGMHVDYVTSTLPGRIYDHGDVYKLLEKVYFDNVYVDKHIFRTVYLHSTFYRHALGSYLIQTKYKTKDGLRVQVGSCLKEDMQEDIQNYLHLSCIWSYDPNNDVSEYIITFDEQLQNCMKEKFVERINERWKGKTLNDKEVIEYIDDKCIKITFSGLVKKIDLLL